MKWLDAYELRARILPAVIVVLPLAISAFLILETLVGDTASSMVQLLSSGVILLALIYAFAFVVRHSGRRIEPSLWSSWGGPPSTRFMRWQDETFGVELKHQFHSAVERVCGIKLKSTEEELDDPQKADDLIDQAFMQVRAIIRRNDPGGVWNSHNAEYGSTRNLLGSRVIWLVFSIMGTVVCGTTWYFTRNSALLVGFLINLAFVAIAAYAGWIFLPKSTKIAADRYGESSWNSFLAAASDER